VETQTLLAIRFEFLTDAAASLALDLCDQVGKMLTRLQSK